MEFEPDRYVWVQVAERLRSRIVDGTYRPKYLLSEVQLMQEFGVARGTLRKAMKKLREEGLLYTVPNLGSFVSAPGGRMEEEGAEAIGSEPDPA
ncbi:winged helix-turn-helix domain-containing protein [Planotetraspora sp. A-T 1434]|uniref:GntR family transcriptional regulator n=1 Tax=Planotetraspora sp. A-T 1434 TaxID=2979219 RepID=UPI0021BFD4DD|nr:winged helix-turn-helix domain-containing protein [Planotetraspora sp. A-T 1434]MCT9931960.1 winged helix-turn-helix domain-containing protein [Planotetraspora sp. A-T 1434]